MNQFEPLLGTYGKIFANGVEWLGVSKFEAGMELAYEDFKMAGSLSTGKKYAGYEIAGNMTYYKKAGPDPFKFSDFQKASKKKPRIQDMIYKLDDPQEGIVAYRLKNVQFSKVPIIKAEVGSLVEDELEFFVESYEPLKASDFK